MSIQFRRLLLLLAVIITMIISPACSNQRLEGREDEDVMEHQEDFEDDRDEDGNDEDEDQDQDKDLLPLPKDSDLETAPPADDPENPDRKQENKTTGQMKTQSWSDVGLTPLPISDLNGLTLNPRIAALLNGSESHSMADYTSGIEIMSDCVVIAPRYTGKIIGDISIGTSRTDVIKMLGEPSLHDTAVLAYRTDVFYLVLLGDTEVEYAGLYLTPDRNYPDDILKRLLEELNSPSYINLQAAVGKVDPEGEFFTQSGFINGGGYYFKSVHGIDITEFDDRTLDVLNNFQGDLYVLDSPDLNYSQSFLDVDAVVVKVRDTMYGCQYTDEYIDKNGKLSPDGKLKAAFEWVYSMDQHFVIRTMDYSVQDRYIYGVYAGDDFYWLNNQVLLYEDVVASCPYVMDINRSMPDHVNILVEAGVVTQADVESFKVHYSITDVNGKVITLKDLDTGATLEVQFNMDSNGKMTFSKKPQASALK